MTAFAPTPAVRLRPEHRVYLGLDPHDGYQRVWSKPSDSVGVVGPPRYGKTSGVIIPALLYWAGPAVSTSTRGDILNFCGDWRRRIAAQSGGRVYVYDPFGSEGTGADSMRWSPLAGCEDPSVCYRRVQAMTAVAGRGLSDGEHWRSGAALLLRGLFHAAALSGAPIAEVRRWLARQEVRRPAEVIRDAGGGAAEAWADDLESVRLLGERERGSFYSVARNCLEATAEPRVLESCSSTDFDVDHFLTTGSTLFVVGPSHYQDVAAPMIVGLIDSIAQRAAELAAVQGGRLSRPLLLALDEVANIAPLKSLPSLVSEGGGRGIITLWAAQSLAQLRARYGAEEQQAILTATTAKIIYGGMSNDADLRNISAWSGEQRVPEVTFYGGGMGVLPPLPDRAGGGVSDPRGSAAPSGLGNPVETGGQHAVSASYRPVLPTEAIQQMPPHNAWLWWQSEPPMQVETRPAGVVSEYERVRGYTPDSGASVR
ncbi:type IV secretory system conjugative DNA transfer family protein [Nocardiopsis rhodophaea]|uniref:type IV secretory system conjugative DNA transfer family protein n=1 Tax=Nocardiopsis rhodophaea TaxID=280238 RepID=UPI0031DACFBC